MDIKLRDRVMYIGDQHWEYPEYYPNVGSVGVVSIVDGEMVKVFWGKKSGTESPYNWYSDKSELRVIHSSAVL